MFLSVIFTVYRKILWVGNATAREHTVQQKVDRSGPVLFSRVRPAIQYQSSTDVPASDITVSVIELGYM